MKEKNDLQTCFENDFEKAFAELPPELPMDIQSEEEAEKRSAHTGVEPEKWMEYQKKGRTVKKEPSTIRTFFVTTIFTLMAFCIAAMLLYSTVFPKDANSDSETAISISDSFSKPVIETPLEVSTPETECVEYGPESGQEEYIEPVRPLNEVTYVYNTLVDVAENTKYATIYAPDYGIESPLYYGDSFDILLGKNFGQSTLTYQIGYQTSHLLCSYDPEIVSGMYQMSIGSKFQIETNYGTYVYIVTGIDHGTVDESTGYIVNASGQQLFTLESDNDLVFLYTDYPANAHTNEKYVIRAIICM